MLSLLQEPVAQGVLVVVVTMVVRTLVSNPPVMWRHRTSRRSDLAVGPDLLLLAAVILAGKLARLYQLRDAAKAHVRIELVNKYVEWTSGLLVLVGLSLLVVVAYIPVAGWVDPPKQQKTQKKMQKKQKAHQHQDVPHLGSIAVAAPLLAGILAVVLTAIVVHASPQ